MTKIKLKTAKELPKSHSGRPLLYPFDEMAVKKYFELPASTEGERKDFYGAYAAARQYAKRQNPKWKFASRIIDGVGQIHRIK